MAKEIERKFLVSTIEMIDTSQGNRIIQGYLPMKGNTVVRTRIKGGKAFLTLKGENSGMSCSEFEYEIPISDAEQIIEELCTGGVIDKTRHDILVDGHLWEVDIFHGKNEGLVVAEIELNSEGEQFSLPSWVSEEVTGQAKYYNSNLLVEPFSQWG